MKQIQGKYLRGSKSIIFYSSVRETVQELGWDGYCF